MRREIISFVVVGVLVNCIYAALFILIVRLAPEQRATASVIAYASACLFQYVANARATFRQRALNPRQFARYAACVFGGLCFSTAILAWAPNWVRVPDLALVIFVAGTIAVANFILFRYWVYNGGKP